MKMPTSRTFFLNFFCILFGIFFGVVTLAQQANSAPKKVRSIQVQRAEVVNQDAAVYSKPDFDSEITYVLEQGDQFDISTITRGPFYRIILDRKNKIYGWVADNDVVPISKLKKKSKKTDSDKVKQLDRENDDLEKDDEYAKIKTFEALMEKRWFGPQVSFVNYTEDTMGRLRSELIPFFGLKIYGSDTLISGPMVMETNILFSQAPKYYKKVTGEKTDGFVFIGDFNFQQQMPLSENQVWSYGFGPLLKYSDLKLKIGEEKYQAQDLTLGINLNVGTLYSFGRFALRSDFKFIVEKKNYFSLSLGLLFHF